MTKQPRKPSTKPEPKPSNSFVDALQFVGMVTKEHGEPYQVHSLLFQNWITAHNRTIGAGHKIAEDIFAAPNNYLMLQALSKCGEHFSITQLDGFRLSIKSDKFKAVVPCLDPVLLQDTSHIPDPATYEITDAFRLALQAVGVLVNEAGDNIINVSIYMNNGSLIASNGRAIFECWHGLPLPFGAALPKAIVGPLAKASKKLIKFGCSQSSVTFWFEDESWLKSQIYAEHWPDVTNVLNQKSNPWPVPADFWNAVAAVAPFSPNGALHFGAGSLSSHGETGVGAAFDVPGLPKGPIFSARLLELIKPHAEQVDFLVNDGRMLMFFGRNIRGAIAGMGNG